MWKESFGRFCKPNVISESSTETVAAGEESRKIMAQLSENPFERSVQQVMNWVTFSVWFCGLPHSFSIRRGLLWSTAWCSEIGSLTSPDEWNSGASSDVREPISLHQTVYAYSKLSKLAQLYAVVVPNSSQISHRHAWQVRHRKTTNIPSNPEWAMRHGAWNWQDILRASVNSTMCGFRGMLPCTDHASTTDHQKPPKAAESCPMHYLAERANAGEVLPLPTWLSGSKVTTSPYYDVESQRFSTKPNRNQTEKLNLVCRKKNSVRLFREFSNSAWLKSDADFSKNQTEIQFAKPS